MDCVKQGLIRFIILIMLTSMFECNTGVIIHKCDFESDMCGWVSGENDTFKWNRTESVNRPDSVVDLTTRDGENCLYMRSETLEVSLFVNLTSPIFNITGESCLSLWYYTSDVLKRAQLYVFLYNSTLNHEFTLKTINKPTSRGWKREQTNLVTTDDYKISITATSQNAFNIIAVDDITITSGSCPQEYIPDGYIGCSEDIPLEQKLPNSSTNNGEECRRRCKSKVFKYAGTKKSYECYCGNSMVDKFTEGALCNMTCPGNEQESCGGSHSMSLYNTFAEITDTEKGLFDRKLTYILIGAGVSLALVIFMVIVVIIRRRTDTSRKIKTISRKQDSTNPIINEYIPEPSMAVVREEDTTNAYSYITLDTINNSAAEGDNTHLSNQATTRIEHDDGANTYHSTTLDTTTKTVFGKNDVCVTEQTNPCKNKAYSHVSPMFKKKEDNTYDHIQDVATASIASGEDENKTTHINNNNKQHGDQSGTPDEHWYDTIKSNKSNKLGNKPDDDYSHLNHNKRTEPLTHTASNDSEHIADDNKYEHFVERKPDVYHDIKPSTVVQFHITEKEDDKDNFIIVDDKETKDSLMFYTLEKL